jgi:hypothetical protein
MQPRLIRRATVSVLLSGALVASVALLAGLPSAAAAGVRAVPRPVSHLTATATSSAVTLKWKNPTKGTFTAVMIRRARGRKAPSSDKAGTLVARVGAPRASYVDHKRAASTTYSYALFAYKGAAYARAADVTVTTQVKPLAGINTFTNLKAPYGFNYPYAMASDGSHLWVANVFGDSVTELSAVNGAWIQTLTNSPSGGYGFDRPQAVTFADGEIWVVNPPENVQQTEYGTIDEIDPATGKLVRLLGTSSYAGDPDFNQPLAVVAAGPDIWVANGGFGTNPYLTEVVAATGVQVREVSGASYALDAPDAMVSTGADIWIANQNGYTVTEVNATTGAFVRNLSGGSYGFSGPSSLAYDGTHVWVTNSLGAGANSVTEIAPGTGDWVQTLTGGSYGFDHPDAIAAAGSHVFVANGGFGASPGTTVTEVNAATGAFVGVLSSASYAFDFPSAIVVQGPDVWVANEYGQSVTEFPAG